MFSNENGLVYPVYVSDQEFRSFLDLLLISEKNNSYYVYVKYFNIFMCNKKNVKIKNSFVDIVCNVIAVNL